MGSIATYIILGVLIVAIVVMFVISGKRRKKQEEDAKNLIEAVKPGNKVKTIGGICGLVVEVDKEENTFVLETGSEQSGKCFIKFDRQAIYQTDAVVEKSVAPTEGETVEEVANGDVSEEGATPEEKAEDVKEVTEEVKEDLLEEKPETDETEQAKSKSKTKK